MTIDPRGLTVTDWCDFMALPLQTFTNTITLLDPLDWKEWALNVIQTPRIAQLSPPDPRRFDDWQEWAIRFNQAVQSLV